MKEWRFRARKLFKAAADGDFQLFDGAEASFLYNIGFVYSYSVDPSPSQMDWLRKIERRWEEAGLYTQQVREISERLTKIERLAEVEYIRVHGSDVRDLSQQVRSISHRMDLMWAAVNELREKLP